MTVWRHFFRLIGECRLAFADLDVIQNAPVCGLVNYRPDYDARFFRIADAHAGGGTEQTLHHAVVVFFENDQPRERGTFLTLKTERGINRIDNRFIQIGVRIDDHCVFTSHLANDALELALAFARFASALPDPQAHLARPREADQI